jgi:hypothetical protein
LVGVFEAVIEIVPDPLIVFVGDGVGVLVRVGGRDGVIVFEGVRVGV